MANANGDVVGDKFRARCCFLHFPPLRIRAFSRPPYALKSDAVNWEMQIASGKTCTKGLKYGSVAISNVKLTAPPEFGKVTVQGPGFSYTAKPDFEGQDAFTIQVTGTMVRMPGTSDIQVTVRVAK